MRVATTLLLLTIYDASAFITPQPTAFGGLVTSSRIPASSTLFAEPSPDEEEEGLDLNLEEMFDMFDAADKEEGFDDAIKKVKGDGN
mmetsp:Transcript_11350/g.13405  ORF Transcript_11350/g.13405 Transcript_11350/m.13405 type:complete len:87 (+) Transcript_11350:58-318(+)|eukprot:CAMPEP_0198249164 /NCGR_PEP_ID=MMETSP1447-20131203/754_1 /TAXON_ID=420782 /ORGANISM="Chaetoceros dichaeta, Strain CCMP1751" /LENGTH=86 /DNA_ID=CAMNT_0043933723 /DNA_START=56 /DNA_END=316 /DNA_ORIENTATION=-